jgi:hypothetical protein
MYSYGGHQFSLPPFLYCAGVHSVLQTLDSSQQTDHVGDIRQAVRFAVSDLKGQDLLPGFCLPKVNYCLPEEGSVAFFA